MARRRRRDKPKGPRFPRRQWEAGQTGRAETPRKGPGSYDRTRERRRAGGEADDALEPPPGEDAPEP